MNRFYNYRDTFEDNLCRIFGISKEVLKTVEGVMLDFRSQVVELRNKNYETVAKITTRLPLTETYNVEAFLIEVVGSKSFNEFMSRIHTEQGNLEWVEIWSTGAVKASFHAFLDFSKTAEGLKVLDL